MQLAHRSAPDPDRDGTNNLGEFFGGGSPNEVDRSEEISISGNPSLFTFKSREPITIPSPLVVGWKSSVNLTQWTDITAGVQYISEIAADTGFVIRSYRYTAPDNPKSLFIRRAVVQP